MIVDCARCGDPLLADMSRCEKCGADNPSFVSKEPEPLWTSDLGIEAGLFVTGLGGLLLGLNALVATSAPMGLRVVVGVFCATVGAGSLVAFRRVHASELSTPAKWALRIGVFGLLILFAFLRKALK